MSNDSPVSVKGLLVILSAPSGCGKTTVVDRLLKRHHDWTRSVSATTRPPRLGEKDGEDYLFLSAGQFQEMEAKSHFLETAKIFDCDYGTPKEKVMRAVELGKKVLLAVDTQGMRKIKKALDKKVPLLTIFILPPSLKALRDRLEGRKTESSEEIERRIELAQKEIKTAKHYDVTVVNQNLEQTVLEIENIIAKYQPERRSTASVLHFS